MQSTSLGSLVKDNGLSEAWHILGSVSDRFNDMILAGKATSTLNAYRVAGRRYMAYLTLSGKPWGRESFVEHCLNLHAEGLSYSTVNNLRCYIQFFGLMEGKAAFCGEHDILNFLKGYKKRWALKGKRLREPISLDMLHTLLHRLPAMVEPRERAEVTLALLLGYWALLRVGETEALYWEDITVVGSRLDIHVRKSKNDQLALGHDIKLDHLSVPRPIRDLI